MPEDLLSCVPVIARSGQPAHEQIQRWLTEMISSEKVGPGERLPSERVLASALSVSRMTLRQALAELEQRGVIVRSRGGSGGAFVARTVVEMELTELVGLTEQVRRVNQRAGARIATARTVPADDVVGPALALPSGAEVHHVVRVRSANDVPVAVEDSFFPEKLFPDMLERELAGSMYDLLSAYGRTPTSATEVVTPGAARAREAELLEVTRKSLVLRVERVAFAADGVPVEFSRDVFHPDRVRFSVRSSLGGGAVVPDARPSEVDRAEVDLRR